MNILRDQRGIGHIIVIVVIAVLVVGGLIAWRVLSSQNTTSTAQNAIEQAIANAKCDYDDTALCKFLTGQKQITDIKVASTITAAGETTSSTYISADKGANYHLITTVNGSDYEIIVIGQTRYTRVVKDGTWWKEAIDTSSSTNTDTAKDYQPTFDDPSTTDTPQANKSVYKKVATEACGSLTCFKYQVTDANADGTEYIWFDTTDYQLRRLRTENGADITDNSFSYDGISVSAPSPTQDLPANSYLVPGQSQPVTLPM